MRSLAFGAGIKLRLASDNGSSIRGHGWWLFRGKNADGKVRREPDRAEKKDDAEEQFCTHACGSVQWRLERSHLNCCSHQDVHGGKGHRYDEYGGYNGSQDRFHNTASKAPAGTRRSIAQQGQSRQVSVRFCCNSTGSALGSGRKIPASNFQGPIVLCLMIL